MKSIRTTWRLLFTSIGLLLFAVQLGYAASEATISDAEIIASDLSWKARAPMAFARYELGAAALDGKIYAVGGFSGSTLSIVEEYDPVANVWTRKADMPTRRRLLVVAAVGGKLYAIGGMDFTNPNNVTYRFENEEYDPVSDSWTSRAPIPMDPPVNSVLGNAFIGGAAAGGKIYVVVFNVATSGGTATYEYDPVSDVWDTNRAPVPFGQTPYAVASLNGKIYAMGTQLFGAASLAEYDPAADIWTVKPSASQRFDFALASSADKLYAIGGQAFPPPALLKTVEVFDPAQSSWQPEASLSMARHSPAVAYLGDSLYVLGGADLSYAPTSFVEATSTSGGIPNLCNLDLRLSESTLTLDFELATPEPVVWSLWFSYLSETALLWRVDIPVVDTPVAYSLPIPDFPPLGGVGFLNTYSTSSQGIVCSDWSVIDTGPLLGNAEDAFRRFLGTR